MALTLRVRGPTGQATLTGLDPSTPLAAFLDRVASETGVPPARVQLLAGFPPAPVTLPDDTAAARLADLGLASGDVLVVREGPGAANDGGAGNDATAPAPAAAPAPAPAAAAQHAAYAPAGMTEDEALAAAIAASLGQQVETKQPAAAAPPPPPPSRPPPRGDGPTYGDVATLNSTSAQSNGGAPTFARVPGDATAVVARRVVDADNSCLFAAVGYVLAGGRLAAPDLRAACAAAVLADAATWSEPVLGRPPREYASWIANASHWGGGIELAILASHFGVEIAAHDVASERVDVYGTGSGYQRRCLLLYDGLHYDALAYAPSGPAGREADDVTTFAVDDARLPAVMSAAAAVASGLRAARQFTDTARFTLRCGVCGVGVVGEADAVAHAKATGHGNFQEY